MIDHIIITVTDYDASKAFYLKALKLLGYDIILKFGKAGGFGVDGWKARYSDLYEKYAGQNITVLQPAK